LLVVQNQMHLYPSTHPPIPPSIPKPTHPPIPPPTHPPTIRTLKIPPLHAKASKRELSKAYNIVMIT
jgi:hypothetical protein